MPMYNSSTQKIEDKRTQNNYFTPTVSRTSDLVIEDAKTDEKIFWPIDNIGTYIQYYKIYVATQVCNIHTYVRS